MRAQAEVHARAKLQTEMEAREVSLGKTVASLEKKTGSLAAVEKTITFVPVGRSPLTGVIVRSNNQHKQELYGLFNYRSVGFDPHNFKL